MSPRRWPTAIGLAMLLLAGSAGSGGCGDEEAPPTAPRSSAREFTSTDGYRYRIGLAVGKQADCEPPPSGDGKSVPVTLTVENLAADRPAPFPPVRIELASAPGVAPERVLVRDPSGSCTSTPRVPSIPPGRALTFVGATPPLAEAGRVDVAISETTFSLALPVP